MRVRLPSDVDVPDRIAAGLTAKQLLTVGIATVVVWGLYLSVGHRMPPLVFGALALPIGALGLAVATARPEGMSFDRLLILAGRYFRLQRRQVVAPSGVPLIPEWAGKTTAVAPLEMPVSQVAADGFLDLGTAGLALVCKASGVNFGLRSEPEQKALIDGLSRLLNSLEGSAQFLIRSDRVDLGSIIRSLEDAALLLPHPALEESAMAHARFLRELAVDKAILRKELLLVLRDKAKSVEEAKARLTNRVDESASMLRAIGITLRPLTQEDAETLLARACDPERSKSGQPFFQPQPMEVSK